MPEKMRKVVETAAKAEGKEIKDYIADAVMLKATGKTKMQFLEDSKKISDAGGNT